MQRPTTVPEAFPSMARTGYDGLGTIVSNVGKKIWPDAVMAVKMVIYANTQSRLTKQLTLAGWSRHIGGFGMIATCH